MEMATPDELPDEDRLRTLFEAIRPYTEHLYRTGDQFWVAETAGEILGYSRSAVRGPVRQLTELFVHPDTQSQGVGKRLLDLALPAGDARNRVVIASPDVRALSRYLNAGVRSRFTIYAWTRVPEIVPFESDLTVGPIEPGVGAMAELDEVDRQVIGYTRQVDHAWLLRSRHGLLFCRAGRAAGYCYLGPRCGPAAMLRNEDFGTALCLRGKRDDQAMSTRRSPK
jgi:GNAT superfamily N-acetyltransferase